MRAPSLLAEEPGLLRCPACGGGLDGVDAHRVRCSDCSEVFPVEDGIPLLFRRCEQDLQGSVTARVRDFYEENPFPDYEDLESSASLKDKARKGIFGRLLDDQIPEQARVLDAGCGTGQLANFLALVPGRTVVGTDLCVNSLRLAEDFRSRHRIDNATFVQMNLLCPTLRPESFDIVICNGVLHHTGAPFEGFQALARLVRERGFILIGLYNKLGRLPTDLRRVLFRLGGQRLSFLDPRLRHPSLGPRRKHSWFRDQYENPHESKHTMGEVLDWFDACNIDFINGIPKPEVLGRFTADEQLFWPNRRGNALDHLVAQLGMFLKGGREGGLFVMIGRKRARDQPSGQRHGSASP